MRLLSTCALVGSLLMSTTTTAQRTISFIPDAKLSYSGSSFFQNIRVVDVRAQQEDIGYVKTGGFNRKAALVTDEPLATTLEKSGGSWFHLNGSGSDKNELLLVVRDFRFQDRPAGQEIGTFHLLADFYVGQKDQYHLFKSVDSLWETKSGWDVTGKIQKMASTVFYKNLEQVAQLSRDTFSGPVYTLASATGRLKDLNVNYPAYRVDSGITGIYPTMHDFLNLNRRDTQIIYTRVLMPDVNIPLHSFYYVKPNGKKGKKIMPGSYFAMSNGKEWFVSGGGYWVKLRKEDGEYYANQWFKGLTTNEGGAIMAGAFFGVAGVLVATAAGSGNQKGFVLYNSRLIPETGVFTPHSRTE